MVEEQNSPWLPAGRRSGFTMDDAEATSATTGQCSKDSGDSEISFSGPACNSEAVSSPAEESAEVFTSAKRNFAL